MERVPHMYVCVGEFKEVTAHYQKKVPYLSVRMKNEEEGGWLECQICCGSVPGVQIARLLGIYCSFNPLVAVLNALFRTWAKVSILFILSYLH